MPKTIIIDAMGGDNAPREILCGVRSAIEDTDARFLLVGRQAEVEPLPYGGFALQYTGSCGESAVLLHQLDIEWQ